MAATGPPIRDLVLLAMPKKKEKDVLQLWDEAPVTQVDGCDVVNPGPQTLYKGTAYPIKELRGQREYFGGPPVVRATADYGQARREAFAEASECQDLEKERVELKAAGVKVAGRAQSCKPRIYRIGMDMEKMADCQDKDPQLIPKVSIDAHAEGLDGLVGPSINHKANDTLLFQPQTTANLTGIRMLDQSEPVDVRPSEERSFFRSPPKPRKSKSRKKKSARPAWGRRGEQRGLF